MADLSPAALPGAALIQSVSLSAPLARSEPQLPSQMAQLPSGSVVNGFVLNRDAAGNPVLRTEFGDISIKSEVFLKTGSDVTIRLMPQGTYANARILTVDQLPLAQFMARQAAAGIQSDKIAPSPLAGSTGQTPSASSMPNSQSPPITIAATLLSPARYGSESQTLQTLAHILHIPINKLPPLQPGSLLQFHLLATQIAGQGAQDSPAPSGALQTQASQQPALNSQQIANFYNAYTKAMPPADANAKTNYSASSVPNLSQAQNSQPGWLSGRVIGNEHGATILRTSIGTLKLPTPEPAPLGSLLQLQYIAGPQASTDMRASTLSAASHLAQEWNSLEETIAFLRQDNPAIAQEAAARLPNTRSELVNSALFFLAALRGSDLSHWLSNNILQKMSERAPQLLSRLGQDFASMRLIASEAPDQQWQMLLFPLLHDDQLSQTRLYYRHDEGAPGESSENETRFIFEIELSELGEMQIDGLVHGPRAGRLLDIVIRSEHALESAMKDDLRSLYTQAASQLGYGGQLRFIQGASELLRPLAEMTNLRDTGNDVIA